MLFGVLLPLRGRVVTAVTANGPQISKAVCVKAVLRNLHVPYFPHRHMALTIAGGGFNQWVNRERR